MTTGQVIVAGLLAPAVVAFVVMVSRDLFLYWRYGTDPMPRRRMPVDFDGTERRHAESRSRICYDPRR